MTSSTGPEVLPHPAALLGLVVLGGALGAASRAALVLPFDANSTPLAPVVMTLSINVVGSFLLGVVVGVLGSGSPRLRAFLGTGLLGGFTTYSAFAVQVAGLGDGRASIALVVAVGSLFFGIVAAVAGLTIGRRFARAPIADPEDSE